MIRRVAVLVAFILAVTLVVPLLGEQQPSLMPATTMGRLHRDVNPIKKDKIYILVIGNDAREGNPDNVRADALHIVGINTKTMRGGILNFPRDSYVSIPGSGSGRINEALYRGGPELQARTLESLTGIKLDYWVMTGFEGFRNIVHRIGAIPFPITRDIFDPIGSGAYLPKGTKALKGEQALAYVRTRKAFPNGDIDRTTNQARFLLAVLRKFQVEVAKEPGALLRWMAITKSFTRNDVSPQQMFRLGILASQMKPRHLTSVTVPVTLGSVGAASVVFIQPGAQSLYARMRRKASL
jgi:polyisoprenyl-teichoic acid--peptidoglycan teichoic acid transferase